MRHAHGNGIGFYFACGPYPYLRPLLEEIEREAIDMVQRLRNHTCLAIWCGDNESDMIEYDQGKDPEQNIINKRILPHAVGLNDPQTRHYHASSPSGGPYPRSDWGGDKRNWGGWFPHYNYRSIRQEGAKIISEGGSYTLPSRECIERYIPSSARWPLTTRTWKLHHGDVDRQVRNLWRNTLTAMNFHHPFRDLTEAIEVSQFAHAWGNKLLVERCRQRKFDCGGVLLWKLSACWPCADGMVIDYELNPVMSLKYISEAYKPIAISMTQDFRDELAEVEVFLCNDMLEGMQGKVTVIATAFAEDRIPSVQEIIFSKEILAEANSSKSIHFFSVKAFKSDTAVFAARWEDLHGNVSYGVYTLKPDVAYRFFKAVNFDYENTAHMFTGL